MMRTIGGGGNYAKRSGGVETKWTIRRKGRRGKWAAIDTNGQDRTIARRSGSERLQDNDRTIRRGGGIMLGDRAAMERRTTSEGGEELCLSCVNVSQACSLNLKDGLRPIISSQISGVRRHMSYQTDRPLSEEHG